MLTTYDCVSPGVINVKDAAGNTAQMRFTSTGQVQSITDAPNRVTQFAYDTNDYLKQITAPGSTVYKFSYDAQGRLLNQTDALNQTVSFTYSGTSSAPLTVTDQKGNKMTYGDDASGNLTGITYANAQAETFTYDASGRLTKATERRRDTFTYSYDSTGKLTRKTFKDNTYEADCFLFDSNRAFNSTIGVDTIADSLFGTDKIVLDKTTFTALSSAAGSAISTTEFASINDATNGATIAGSGVHLVLSSTALWQFSDE